MRFSFFCKTFLPDLERFGILLGSLRTYAADVPLIVSIPSADIPAFRNAFGSEIGTLVADEEYADFSGSRMSGWQKQQVCKLSAWKLGLADVLHCIDSDFYLVRPVTQADFFDADGRPYLTASTLSTKWRADHRHLLSYILHGERKWREFDPASFPTLGVLNPNPFRSLITGSSPSDLRATSANARKVFGIDGAPWLHYMPGASIFSAAMDHMKAAFLDPYELSVADLIRICPWEYHWHADWCLATRCTAFAARESFYLHFASDDDIRAAQNLGVTEKLIADRFYGIALAARHQKLLRFGNSGPA